MANLIARYARWLHLKWPAGRVERLPEVHEDGSTGVPGLYVIGDLTGVPLLKLAADGGARVVQKIAQERKADGAPRAGSSRSKDPVFDVAILGGGVSGMAAALECRRQDLSFVVLEASEPFSTIANFPRAKPIYTYPVEMTPEGELQFSEQADVKERLLKELRDQTLGAGIEPRIARVESVQRRGDEFEVILPGDAPVRARRVVIAIGRSGNFRRLGVPGEDLDKVTNRLHDPQEFADQDALVVGGGDSALETALALAEHGARVTLSYRGEAFSRPKPDNATAIKRLEDDGQLRLLMMSEVKEITPDDVSLKTASGEVETLPNTALFAMIGREPPLDFFRRSGVKIRGEWTKTSYASLVLVLLAAVFVYHWKKGGTYFGIAELFAEKGWFPNNVPGWWDSLGGAFADKTSLLGTVQITLGEAGFYYSFAYCACVAIFGIRRVKRRKTPYVKLQTWTLALIQIIPLFLLPYVVLPYLGNNGAFDSGVLGSIADELFPSVNYGHGREYWRAFGLILAWPLFIWNVFTDQPMWGWLAISVFQTFVIIPLIVWRWGKGAYCGWICSCGALAETMGDNHRTKMPHGGWANRLNFVGQAFLVMALVLLLLRAWAWASPGGFAGEAFTYLFKDMPVFNYAWFVDLLWAGILGVGLYWHFSGRVWCRFACPLAALMHIYARFSQFRILADKKKCISCNVCTSVCHQGIDIMSFANKGAPMADPQCVRCSACVSSCPTGVLEFGRVDPKTGAELGRDRLVAAAPK